MSSLLLVRVKTSMAIMKIRLFKKFNAEISYEPARPLLGIDPKHFMSYNRNTCASMFTAATFTTAGKQNQPRCPSPDGQVSNMRCAYTVEFHSPVKKIKS